MGVQVTKTFGSLADLRLTDAALMREVGLLARERLIRRTIAGRDQDDQPFAPYSAAYAGLRRKEQLSTNVNLQVSGQMLNAIRIVAVTDTSVTLGFA